MTSVLTEEDLMALDIKPSKPKPPPKQIKLGKVSFCPITCIISGPPPGEMDDCMFVRTAAKIPKLEMKRIQLDTSNIQKQTSRAFSRVVETIAHSLAPTGGSYQTSFCSSGSNYPPCPERFEGETWESADHGRFTLFLPSMRRSVTTGRALSPDRSAAKGILRSPVGSPTNEGAGSYISQSLGGATTLSAETPRQDINSEAAAVSPLVTKSLSPHILECPSAVARLSEGALRKCCLRCKEGTAMGKRNDWQETWTDSGRKKRDKDLEHRGEDDGATFFAEKLALHLQDQQGPSTSDAGDECRAKVDCDGEEMPVFVTGISMAAVDELGTDGKVFSESKLVQCTKSEDPKSFFKPISLDDFAIDRPEYAHLVEKWKNNQQIPSSDDSSRSSAISDASKSTPLTTPSKESPEFDLVNTKFNVDSTRKSTEFPPLSASKTLPETIETPVSPTGRTPFRRRFTFNFGKRD